MMIALGLIQAGLVALAVWGAYRAGVAYDSLYNRYRECKAYSSLAEPQYETPALVTKRFDSETGDGYFVVYIYDPKSGCMLNLRKFEYDKNDKDDEEYAKNCAVELCDQLNYDYSITK